jgi:hypothetical protein
MNSIVSNRHALTVEFPVIAIQKAGNKWSSRFFSVVQDFSREVLHGRPSLLGDESWLFLQEKFNIYGK